MFLKQELLKYENYLKFVTIIQLWIGFNSIGSTFLAQWLLVSYTIQTFKAFWDTFSSSSFTETNSFLYFSIDQLLFLSLLPSCYWKNNKDNFKMLCSFLIESIDIGISLEMMNLPEYNPVPLMFLEVLFGKAKKTKIPYLNLKLKLILKILNPNLNPCSSSKISKIIDRFSQIALLRKSTKKKSNQQNLKGIDNVEEIGELAQNFNSNDLDELSHNLLEL
ncbi:hypothetical protein BpHYR1_041377 [Brachionus plicatilis]|uniref:Uncharacterized protein n=1 Tax=Brachionus plicatilis TaxID=10195 RepID=A0A3M7SL86_BRAPC|nr:hypothetical protein BpHYR1_041377 [Brachionus plicatilis]